MLTLGFFAGLPLVYTFAGSAAAVILGLWLWCLMMGTAAHLWWPGRRVYPDAGPALLVPFHAMRAFEIASVHAMGTTHPAALLLWARDLENPWLAGFIRRVLHPFPEDTADTRFSKTLKPLLEDALAGCGKRLDDFDSEPDGSKDAEAKRYCPRCHGLFLGQITCCTDCHGIPLRPLTKSSSA